jgi:hypothetical protein
MRQQWQFSWLGCKKKVHRGIAVEQEKHGTTRNSAQSNDRCSGKNSSGA